MMLGSSLAMGQGRFLEWAPTPPMGWNSWDCFGVGVTEQQVKENADYMAEKLARFGWQYIVVDHQWYEPQAHGHRYRDNADLCMDEHGRLLPTLNRFPSAADGKGFKPLADYVHGKGLKFGIHLMRGIPRQAVEQNRPILGTNHRASDIADKNNLCAWNRDMYGVDMSKPGAQEYYNSVFELIASWGVDFVKVDDLSRPYHNNIREVEAVRRAIDRTGRPIVLSMSPGETALDAAEHAKASANMWRISDDFWDEWRHVKEQFDRCRRWAEHSGPGHWPDADMLPFGAIRMNERPGGGWTRFTRDEQYTVMTLWAVFRSPLMMGGHLPRNDEFTLSLLTNDEVIPVNQHGRNARELSNEDGLIIWTADAPDSSDKYVALFNTRDPEKGADPAGLLIKLVMRDLGLAGQCRIRDLWQRRVVAEASDELPTTIPYHGAGLYRVTPLDRVRH